MYKLLIGLVGLLVVAAIVPIAVIFFDAPASPPPMASMAPPVTQINEDFPAPRHFQARDGLKLEYYAYPAEPDKAAVLMHGSAGSARSMHALAEFLRAGGTTVYVPEIRGHGSSGRRGDIDYIGRIDDDLADFVSHLGSSGAVRREHSSVSLLGRGSLPASPVDPTATCLTAMCFSPQSFQAHQLCARTPAVGPTLLSHA
jgi:alpha-beta hydrolase superfamily lysophospholipase